MAGGLFGWETVVRTMRGMLFRGFHMPRPGVFGSRYRLVLDCSRLKVYLLLEDEAH